MFYADMDILIFFVMFYADMDIISFFVFFVFCIFFIITIFGSPDIDRRKGGGCIFPCHSHKDLGPKVSGSSWYYNF